MKIAQNVLFMPLVLILLFLSPVLAGEMTVLRPDGALNQSEYDTVSWRTLSEPTVNFWYEQGGLGDSIAVWFKPDGPCSLIAVRFYSYDFQGTCLANVWDGSRYDGHITTTDSTDSNGWIGNDVNGQWISGEVMGHSPISWTLYDEHHYWGQFPFVITEAHLGKWFEIPAKAGGHRQVDLGDGPFFLVVTLYRTTGRVRPRFAGSKS